jgi:hypothetical protein
MIRGREGRGGIIRSCEPGSLGGEARRALHYGLTTFSFTTTTFGLFCASGDVNAIVPT